MKKISHTFYLGLASVLFREKGLNEKIPYRKFILIVQFLLFRNFFLYMRPTKILTISLICKHNYNHSLRSNIEKA